MVDTKKIKANLGSRDSIGLKRADVLELVAVYEGAVEAHELKNKMLEEHGRKTTPWSWSDWAPKH